MHFSSLCTQVFWVGFVLFTILLLYDPCVNSPLSWKVHALSLEILFVTSGYLQCYFTPKLWLIFYVYIEIFNWGKKEPDYIKVTAAWDIQLRLLVVNTEHIGSFFILHLKNPNINQFNKHCYYLGYPQQCSTFMCMRCGLVNCHCGILHLSRRLMCSIHMLTAAILHFHDFLLPLHRLRIPEGCQSE